MAGFFHYTLRTTDVDAARRFYSTVLGRNAAEIVRLHEQALARGARPHWLGYVEVDDVDAAALAFSARGASPLGPKWVNATGLEAAVVRDPGGAIVALAKPAPATRPSGVSGLDVVWQQLNTADVEKAKADYGEIFGWRFEEPRELGGALAISHPFRWQAEGAPVGGMSDIVGRPRVHPHWLFHYRVASLAPALERVRAGGGSYIGPFMLPNGDRVAACDDPQGAAFGLLETPA